MARSVTIKVDEVMAATDLALLCEIAGEEVWIPRSQITSGELEKGDSGELEITEWIAKQKGLD